MCAGAGIVSNISSKLLNKPHNGAFFDACTHHCTSCSVINEDSWNGDHIKSTDRINSDTNNSKILVYSELIDEIYTRV